MTKKEREERWQAMLRRSAKAREEMRQHMEDLRAGKYKPSELKEITPEMERRLREVYKGRPME